MTTQPSTLIFVYNANSGLINGAPNLLHKTSWPYTCAYNLCAITYDTFDMRRAWRDFVNRIPRPVCFLHRNELTAQFGDVPHPLPAAFLHLPDGLHLIISADEMNACGSLEELVSLVDRRIS